MHFDNHSSEPQTSTSAIAGRRIDGAGDRSRAELALYEAQRVHQRGDRLDMKALASTLGVDRTTLFRWVGSRERLLGEVLWSLTRGTYRSLELAHRDDEGPIAAKVLSEAVRLILGNHGQQKFHEREGELALRILTTKAGEFQQRFIELIADIVDRDRQMGLLRSVIPDPDLPYILVRIIESYVYFAVITGEQPDPDRASQVLHAILPA